MTMKEPRPASSFRLKLQGVEAAGLFRECTGIGAEVNVIETQTASEQGSPRIRKVSGGFKYTNIELKRGADPNRMVYDWWKKVETGDLDAARVDGTIEVIDYKQKPIHVYSFKQGWPTKWQGASITAQSNEMAIESLTIAHEGIERVS